MPSAFKRSSNLGYVDFDVVKDDAHETSHGYLIRFKGLATVLMDSKRAQHRSNASSPLCAVSEII